MDLTAILKELRDQLDTVKQAIAGLEHLAAGQRKGPGRPPKWVKQLRDATPKSGRGRVPKSGETP